MILLAIDPGACAGFALFVNGELADCGLVGAVDLPVTLPLMVRPDVCVVERAHQGQGKATLKDLITLSIRAGALAQAAGAPDTRFLEPGTWKGSAPKHISERRVAEALTPDEQARVLACLRAHPAALRHNALDAIGIGLHFLRRTRV